MYNSSNAFEVGEALGFASESSDATFSIIPGFLMDTEDDFDDLRHKLITLNSQLRRIDGRFDYSIKTKMFYAFSVRSSRSGYESDSMMKQLIPLY